MHTYIDNVIFTLKQCGALVDASVILIIIIGNNVKIGILQIFGKLDWLFSFNMAWTTPFHSCLIRLRECIMSKITVEVGHGNFDNNLKEIRVPYASTAIVLIYPLV